jgi:hypothetical protein
VNDEYLSGLMAVLRVDAVWWLACTADIESVWNVDVHVLIRILGNARPNDCKILFFLPSRRTGVYECRGTGPQVLIADKAVRKHFAELICGKRGLIHMMVFLRRAFATG